METESEHGSAEIIKSAAAYGIDMALGPTIPMPIRRNFFKAASQLCSAVIEIPIAYFEGKADEIRAETEGRVQLLKKSANEIAENMEFSPEYARCAAKKYGQRIVRGQINLDKITEKAAKIINESFIPEQNAHEQPNAEISNDWLNEFEKEAAQKSTEEMQAAFAKVLAGEIQRPSSFSIKSIRVLASMDQSVALLFRKLCSMTISLGPAHLVLDARVASIGKSVSNNGLKEFDLIYANLVLLQEYGLIINDLDSWHNYHLSVDGNVYTIILPFMFENSMWYLRSAKETQVDDLRISGISLTRSGKELMRVVGFEEVPDYRRALIAWFGSKNLTMLPMGVKQG